MDIATLSATAKALVAPGKGILAADESSGTIKKRFDSIGTESTEDNRRDYREMLFTTKGASDFISGVILFDETIRQNAADGTPLVKVLRGPGHHPRHQGRPRRQAARGSGRVRRSPRVSTACASAWPSTTRSARASPSGARPTRSATRLPSAYCIDVNAHALARYAALCQEAGIVPIVEPEVLMDGDHTIERSFEVTTAVLDALYEALYLQRVRLDGTLLKPNMVLSGYGCPQQASVEEVAEATVRCFRATVPAAVPGIVFLSGGQSDELATAHLNAMNRLDGRPWQLSFSYGRALQAPALKAWKGEAANVDAGKDAFFHRAKLNSAARSGSYSPDMEKAAS